MEDHIIEFVCSDDFEHELDDVLAMKENMHNLEYKLVSYLDLCTKLSQQEE